MHQVGRPHTTLEKGEPAVANRHPRRLRHQVSLQKRRRGGGRSTVNASERDALTGLANRQGFNRAVRELIDGNPGEQFVLLYGDVDRFKVFNDRFGTEAGDKLLTDAGALITSMLPEKSVAARLRADHFVACLPRARCDPEAALRQIDDWFAHYPADFAFFIRLGVYEVDDPTLDVSLMTDRALLALRAAKTGTHASKYARFDESLRDTVVKEQEMAGEMADALTDGQFELYFQPQYRYSTGELVGAEVLTRWNHPKKGLISPAEFIPVFERTGLISNLDYYIWAEACRCLRTWLDEAGPGYESQVPRLSVNLSRADIYREDLCEYLEGLLHMHNLPHHLFHLEITESAYVEAPDQLTEAVERLRGAGFTVEMDDFGSGYSSLNVLKDVPVDVLKLDLRFLDARNDTRGGIILASVVRMARWLELPAIAEGVESESQAIYLASIGCDVMQGFWFSQPVDRATFEQLMREATLGDFDLLARARDRARVSHREATRLWDADSVNALVFNSYMGPAALGEFDGEHFEVIRANDDFYRMLGLPLDRFARTVEEVFGDLAAEDRSGFDQALERAAAESESECELCVRGRGEDCWVHVSARVLAQEGAISSVLLLLLDVTEVKKADLRFKNQAELQQQLYDSLPCGVVRYTVEDNPKFVSANQEAVRILSCANYEDMVAMTRRDVFAPLTDEGREDMLGILQRLRAGSGPIPFSNRLTRKNGEVAWVEGVSALVTTADGRTIAQSAFNDVTAVRREQHERELERFTTVLCGVFDEVFEMNLMQDTFLMRHSRHGDADNARPIPLDAALNRWLAHIPAEEDRTRLEAAVRNFRRRPPEQPVVFTYAFELDNVGRYYESTFLRASDTSVLCCNNDVTERTRAENARLDRRVNDIVANLPSGIGVYDIDHEGTHPRYVSDVVCQMLGKTREEYDEIIAVNGTVFDPADSQRFLARSAKEGGSREFSVEHTMRRDGQPFIMRVQGRAIPLSDGVLRAYVVLTDITDEVRERRRQSWQTERYRILSELTHAISFDYDSESDTVLLYIDRTGKGMEPQVIPNYLETLTDTRAGVVHPDSMETVRAMFERVREGTTNEIIEYRADYYGTGYQWYRTNLFVAHDEGGSWHLVGLIENIQTERELRLRAEVDAVTGLSNYAAAHDLVNNALADPHLRAHSACAVVDLDNFKAVNDTFGHLKGDELLQQVGKVLRSNCRETDIVGRVGGDEFVVLLKNINLEVALRKFAAMKRAVAALFDSDAADAGLYPTISIGVAVTRATDERYEDVFARADQALYQAKHAGKNRLRVCKGEAEEV